MKLTMHSAREAAGKNDIENWVHEFLLTEGNNQALSDGLKLEPRVFLGPAEMPMGLLERCCGPEQGMKYQVSRESFEERVGRIMTALKQGFSLPPLIVNYDGGKWTLSDGNHRYEALVRSGIKDFPVVIWVTESHDLREVKQKYKRHKSELP